MTTRGHGWVPVLALLAMTASCEKKARLRVTASGKDISADVTRLFGLFRFDPEVTSDGDVVTAKVRETLDGEDRLAIDDTLRRVSGFKASPVDAPFELVVTEADPRRVAAAKLPGAKGSFPIKLRPGEGKTQLKSVHIPLVVSGDKEICSYDVPLINALPTLSVPADAGPRDRHRKNSSTLAEFIEQPTTLESEIRPVDPDLRDVVDRIYFVDSSTIAFVFKDKDVPMRRPLDYAGGGEFAECARLVLGGGEAFVARVVFPDLVGRIRSFELDETYF